MRTLRKLPPVGAALLLCVLLAPSLHAQVPAEATDVASPIPVRLRSFEGTVTVQRATGGETAGGEVNLPLDAGDRLWTDAQGRAELVLPDGSLMWLDRLATIDVVALPRTISDGEVILRLWNGSAVISRATAVGATALRIDTADASLGVMVSANARVDIDEERRVWLSVYDGSAQMSAGGVSERVTGGQRTLVEPGTAPAEAFAFNTAERDEFDRWQADRYAALLTTERHVRDRSYVPSEIAVHAADLETHGSWFYYDDFDAWAWRPTTVAVSWAPYRYGRWVYGYGGWTWVSSSPWGWVTGHYGRWHHLPTWGWVWFPGSVYSTAWVSWGVSGGYVGWSPIGFWGVPLVSINLWFGGHYGYGHGYHGGYNYPWHGYYPGYGRPGGGVAVPRGQAVAGRGYTRGDARPEPWNFVRSDELGRRDLDRRVVSRDAVRPGSGSGGSLQINGPLRPRDPTGLAIGGGRLAVSRDDAPRTGGTGVAGGRGTVGGTDGARPTVGGRTVVPRPGAADAGRAGGVGARPVNPRPGDGSGARPTSPGRSVTIRPEPGTPPRAIVPRGDSSPRPTTGGGGRTVVPRAGGQPGSGAPAPRPSIGSGGPAGTAAGGRGIAVPRAVPRSGGLLGGGGTGSPYRAPAIAPRGSSPARGGSGLARPSLPGLSRPSIPGLSRSGSPGSRSSIAPRPGASSPPRIARPGAGAPRSGSVARPPSPSRSGSGASRPSSAARRAAKPRGRGQ